MGDPETTSSGHSRKRFATELRTINPRRLAEWKGFNVTEGIRFNPYDFYAIALRLQRDRPTQVAEILIGDIVADAMLHPSMTMRDRGARP